MSVVLLALSAFPTGAADERWNLVELMRNLKAVDSSRAQFFERKELAILDRPLESSGTLIYQAPARLEKRTLAPEGERLVLDGDELTIEGVEGGWKKSFALREHPIIRAVVESIRSTLAGDLATLRRFYDVQLQGRESSWQLALTPRDAGMKAVVEEILISGSGKSMSRVEIREVGGDRSVMTIDHEGS